MHVIALTNDELQTEMALLNIYRSQFPDANNLYFRLPKHVLRMVSRYECYYEVNGKSLAALIIPGLSHISGLGWNSSVT